MSAIEPPFALVLTADTTALNATLSAAEQLAGLSEDFRDALLALFDAPEPLFTLETLADPAVAGQLIVRFEPSDGLQRLLAASGAWDGDRLIIEHQELSRGCFAPPLESESPGPSKAGPGDEGAP